MTKHEFKIGDIVRTFKTETDIQKSCQRSSPPSEKCKDCGIFNQKVMKIIGLRAGRYNDIVVEVEFEPRCNLMYSSLSSGYTFNWKSSAIEKIPYKWVKMK